MKPTSLSDGGGAPCDYTSSLDEAFSFVNAFNFQAAATSQFPQAEYVLHTAADRLQVPDQDQAGPHSRKQLPTSRQQSQARVSSHSAKANCVRQQRGARNTAELSRHRSQVNQQYAGLQNDEDYSGTDEPTDEKCSGIHTAHSDVANWLQQAALEYEELQKSEHNNNNLKSQLAGQVELQKCLETELREAMELQRDCRVLTAPRRSPPIKIEPRVTQGSPYIRTEQLHKSMCALYRDTDAILRQIESCSDLTSIFSSSQSKRCPVRGPIFELKTSAPVSCCIKSLGDLLWRTLGGCEQERRKVQVEEEKDDEDQDVKMEEDPAAIPDQIDSCEKWSTQNLPTQYGEVQVHGASVVRKFAEIDRVKAKDPLRIVFTFASSVAASNSRDLVFHETGWFVLTQLGSSTSSSLFQTFYRLQVQNVPPRDADDAYLQELVMNALSNRTRKHHQHIQDKLLAHSKESDAEGLFGRDFVAFDSGIFHGAPCG